MMLARFSNGDGETNACFETAPREEQANKTCCRWWMPCADHS